MRPVKSLVLLVCVAVFFATICPAEEADDVREKGIAALKESQANPRTIVNAARFFVKASELYAAAGNDDKAIEMNSFLYWCKKKMTMEDIDAFVKGGEAAVSTKLNAIKKLAPKGDEAQAYLDRAEQFAYKNPAEHLLIAIRFYEVADRFKGSDASMKALDRSLKEQLQDKSNGTKSIAPPVAVRVPDTAPASVGTRPVPSADDIKQAEKLIKDLLKDDYAKTDAPGRLALMLKLMQQADENKGDAASEYVLLHEARDYAVAAGYASLATHAQKRLRDAFKIDFAAMMIDLRNLESMSRSAEPAAALATLFLLEADDALAVDNYDQAVRYNLRAEDLLPLINNAALKERLKAEIPRVLALKQASAAALAAFKTLTTKPDDPDANLTAGKFALQKGEFEKAFVLLAKCKFDLLDGLAKRELTPSADATEQAKLGDDWFDRAEKETNVYIKTHMNERAALWYGKALPALSGLAKLKVEGRMKTLFQEWMSAVQALPAEKQVDAVIKKLVELNPRFDGKFSKPKIENGVVTEFQLCSDGIDDVSPVRALRHLANFSFTGRQFKGRLTNLSGIQGMSLKRLNVWGNLRLSDLTALKGMPLTRLIISHNVISDFSALQGMQLNELECDHTKITDLSPLSGMPLKRLWCDFTQISDLSPLIGMPLNILWVFNTKVTDLSPLAGMPLTELRCSFVPERDSAILRKIKTLEKINNKPVAEFWTTSTKP